MKIFFDTEFYENGRTIDLISIGMVREDGEEYYAETAMSKSFANRSQWLKDNVLPHLKGGSSIIPLSQIVKDVRWFAGDKPEFWAYYADYDWVVLCQLYGTMMQLPDGWPMFCMDIKQLAVSLGDPKLPPQGEDEHNALADALWNKITYEWLLALPKF